MDFDRSAVRHQLAVAAWDSGQYDVFVRTDDGDIEHYWSAGEGVMFGPERLGGRFDSDPVVQSAFDGVETRLHLLGRVGIRIVDWSWPSQPPGWLGAPSVQTLPGYCLRELSAISTGLLNVYSFGIEGALRQWGYSSDGWHGPHVLGDLSGGSTPAAVRRHEGLLDVFGVNGGLIHFGWDDTEGLWRSEFRGGENITGPVTAASYERDRLDVFALRSDGVPVHWGWNGARWFDAEARLDMGGLTATGDLQLVEFGLNRLTLFARTSNGRLTEWTFESPDHWSGPHDVGDGGTPFAAWSIEDDQLHVLQRRADGGFTHDFWVNEPGHGMGDPVYGTWESEGLDLAEPAPPPVAFSPAPVDPDLLLVRPRDLVLLGVRWDGFQVQAAPGAAAELAAGPGALTVLFPPQHLAEEVVAASGPVAPGVDPATTGGFPSWRAALSGASRVVVDLDDGRPVPLTAEGILDGLRRGRVRPADGVLDRATAVEIPYGLLLSPHADSGVACGHPADVVEAAGGAVGLWQARLSADGTAAGSPAGLVLRPLAADAADPFPVPLTGGARTRILIEEPTARIDRLTLSTLGGGLTVAGAWPGFSWAHVATLGRDQRVRVTVEGVLYPFGHRAEYVELTERVFESTADGAIAHLRKSTSLRVTEPVRREPADAAVRAAFPFAEVEIGRLQVEGIDLPQWTRKVLPSPERENLELFRDVQLGPQADSLYEALYGDMGPGGGIPPTEDLAAGLTDDAGEPLDPDNPFVRGDPETILTRALAAAQYLELRAQIDRIGTQLAALAFGGTAPVDVFFTPHLNGQPLPFPVRLAGRLGDLHVELPLIFVADIDRPVGLLTPQFRSLTDFEILGELAAAYLADADDGVVDVGSTPIDLVRAPVPQPADVCQVRRLHVVGVPHDDGFRARLGAPPAADEGDVPPPQRWGFDADLPAVRALLGGDQPPLRLALSRALLQSAPDPQIAFQVPQGLPALATTFATHTGRSGGICAPDIVADGISRTHGPVNVAGMLARTAGALDPKKILSDGATLLGFPLSDLISSADLSTPPQILTVQQPGGPPKVTMNWTGVKLHTDGGPFVTRPDSTVDVERRAGCRRAEGDLHADRRGAGAARPGAARRRSDAGATAAGLVRPDRLRTGRRPRPDAGRARRRRRLLRAAEAARKASAGRRPRRLRPAHRRRAGRRVRLLQPGRSGCHRRRVPVDRPGAQGRSSTCRSTGGRSASGWPSPAGRSRSISCVLLFGGGGYVDILIDRTGLRRLEIDLEFGASLSMNFVVARGEVHALGGIRMVKNGDQFAWSGYLRFGGSLSVFGLVTVSVELTVTLTYVADEHTERLTGRATLVLEIDLTLFSESVELDAGDWELIGGSSARRELDSPLRLAGPGDGVPEQWRRYRAAFAKGTV